MNSIRLDRTVGEAVQYLSQQREVYKSVNVKGGEKWKVATISTKIWKAMTPYGDLLEKIIYRLLNWPVTLLEECSDSTH